MNDQMDGYDICPPSDSDQAIENERSPQPVWPQRLLTFYQAGKRDLPWRKTLDPYAIYVSEIMLQQTRVQTVIPYYEHFLDRYPNLDSLAQADPDELHKCWEGLGYYSRARQMQKAAVLMVADHGSQIPEDQKELLALPGIGAYTVGAISSIAFGKPIPAVDGNVVRVISRLYGLPMTQGAVVDRDRVAQLVAPLIPPATPGDFNQALMELGALTCTSANPRCETCPIQSDCVAFAQGRVAEFPLKHLKKLVPEEIYTVVVVKIGKYFRVNRRTEKLLSGLYQFDLLPGRLDGNAVRDLMSGATYHKQALGSDLAATAVITSLPDKIHRFTHRIWRLSGFYVEIERDDMDLYDTTQINGEIAGSESGFSYVTESKLNQLPFPTAFSSYRADVLSIH